MYWKQRGIIIS